MPTPNNTPSPLPAKGWAWALFGNLRSDKKRPDRLRRGSRFVEMASRKNKKPAFWAGGRI